MATEVQICTGGNEPASPTDPDCREVAPGSGHVLPMLRRDLIINERRQEEGTYYLIKDPISLRYFKIAPDEFFIIRMLDGETSPEFIAQSFLKEYGLQVEIKTVERFILKLNALGFLETSAPPVSTHASIIQHDSEKRVSFFQKALFIRVRAVNPDRLFNALIDYIGFFFTKYFLAVAFASIIGAVVIFLKSRSQLFTQMSELFALHYVLGFWVAALLIATLHEFAHGLTCKHYGGEVREMGFLLLYFNPALYCNVSDAWCFPERSKRLWVMFAGGFFESFIWAAAVILWSVVPAGTLASRLCLMVITISGVKILFNFNPLIKLDGYYLLSDYLEMPNLRSKAFSFLKTVLKTKLFKRQSANRSLSRKERRVYWVYGVLASVYTIGLICLMFWKLSSFLISKYHGTGVLILAGVVTLIFGDLLLNTAIGGYRFLLRKKMLPQYRL